MLAIHLQSYLAQLCGEAEMAPAAISDMERRFQSLRAYGRLPSGRENRGQPLNDRQIACVILGLAVVPSGWAGHATAVMERRFPVGGVAEAFAGAPTLVEALVKILSDEEIRTMLVVVRLSTAEGGVNSHGFATIVHDQNGIRKHTHYVPEEAVSLLQPGAESTFDPDRRYAPFAHEVVFNRQFFDQLTKRIARDRAYPLHLPDDSSEYDSEEAERARRERLGATSSSNFLNIGVDNQVTWPKQEMLISFDRYRLVLMPKTMEHVQSISIDLHANRVTADQGLTVINRFLSLLTWCDDQFAVAQHGWSGNPVPVPVSKRDLMFATTHQWVFDRTIPISEEGCRALALYREARNAEQNFMVSYAVLNYYKIIELRHHGWKASTEWVAANLASIINDQRDQHGITEFLAACRTETPEMYIYAACRVAVAHASPHRVSDPDEALELQRLHNAADVMRRLARRFIELELGISASPFTSVD